jgi:hypothetical protein
VANRDKRKTSLNGAAEQLGSALGHVAARIDRWKKDQASIAADLQNLMKSAQKMLSDLGGSAAGGFKQARKGGRPKGYKTTPETRAKLRAAWARRKKTSDPAKASSKPVDQRSLIRSKAPATWSNRQPGRG